MCAIRIVPAPLKVHTCAVHWGGAGSALARAMLESHPRCGACEALLLACSVLRRVAALLYIPALVSLLNMPHCANLPCVYSLACTPFAVVMRTSGAPIVLFPGAQRAPFQSLQTLGSAPASQPVRSGVASAPRRRASQSSADSAPGMGYAPTAVPQSSSAVSGLMTPASASGSEPFAFEEKAVAAHMLVAATGSGHGADYFSVPPAPPASCKTTCCCGRQCPHQL